MTADAATDRVSKARQSLNMFTQKVVSRAASKERASVMGSIDANVSSRAASKERASIVGSIETVVPRQQRQRLSDTALAPAQTSNRRTVKEHNRRSSEMVLPSVSVLSSHLAPALPLENELRSSFRGSFGRASKNFAPKPLEIGSDEEDELEPIASVELSGSIGLRSNRFGSGFIPATPHPVNSGKGHRASFDKRGSIFTGDLPIKLTMKLDEAMRFGAPPKKSYMQQSEENEKEGDPDAATRWLHCPSTFVRRLMIKKCGHPLIAWRHHFDPTYVNHADIVAFRAGLSSIGYSGDAGVLFDLLEKDVRMGFITLNEICVQSAELWLTWCRWCGSHFASLEDFVRKMSGDVHKTQQFCESLTKDVAPQSITRKQFVEHLIRSGWHGWYEGVLFSAICIRQTDEIHIEEIRSMYESARQQHEKRMNVKNRLRHTSNVQHNFDALHNKESFIRYMLLVQGNLYHAWRHYLDPHGIMCVQRRTLNQVCHQFGWSGDIPSLWRVLDEDDTGEANIESFAPQETRLLGRWKKMVDEKYGSFVAAHREMSISIGLSQPCKSLSEDQWYEACDALLMPQEFKAAFSMLDFEEHGYLTARDLKFFDAWKVPDWLVADPDHSLVDEFRQMIMAKVGHPLRAWRSKLDKDGTGKVTYTQFRKAAHNMGFKSDIPSLWAALDDDSSGRISLAEVDAEGGRALVEFRRWAHSHFGDVHNLFVTLDQDHSGDLTLREFVRAMRKKGFRGNAEALFKILDVDASGALNGTEVAFLDAWDLCDLGGGKDTGDDYDSDIDSDVEFSPPERTDSPSRKNSSPRHQADGEQGSHHGNHDEQNLVKGLGILQLVDWMAIDSHQDVRGASLANLQETSTSAVRSPGKGCSAASPASSAWWGSRSIMLTASRNSAAKRLGPAKESTPIYFGGLPYSPRAVAATRAPLSTLKVRRLATTRTHHETAGMQLCARPKDPNAVSALPIEEICAAMELQIA